MVKSLLLFIRMGAGAVLKRMRVIVPPTWRSTLTNLRGWEMVYFVPMLVVMAVIGVAGIFLSLRYAVWAKTIMLVAFFSDIAIVSILAIALFVEALS